MSDTPVTDAMEFLVKHGSKRFERMRPLVQQAISELPEAERRAQLAWRTVPAKPWYVRLWRLLFPLKGIELKADGTQRKYRLSGTWF